MVREARKAIYRFDSLKGYGCTIALNEPSPLCDEMVVWDVEEPTCGPIEKPSWYSRSEYAGSDTDNDGGDSSDNDKYDDHDGGDSGDEDGSDDDPSEVVKASVRAVCRGRRGGGKLLF